jgi:hypothetical protein
MQSNVTDYHRLATIYCVIGREGVKLFRSAFPQYE